MHNQYHETQCIDSQLTSTYYKHSGRYGLTRQGEKRIPDEASAGRLVSKPLVYAKSRKPKWQLARAEMECFYSISFIEALYSDGVKFCISLHTNAVHDTA